MVIITNFINYNSLPFINYYLLPNNFTGVAYDDISKFFVKNDNLHRYYGPAKFYFDGYKSWCFNNKFYEYSNWDYNQKHFIKDISKQWLL